METTDPPCSEKSDQQKVEDDQDPVQARSYECTFCKRGFSNAQALGGHMNIHRKDRAKLKQPSNLTKLPLDITKRSLSYPLLANKSELLEYIEDKRFNPMLPWTLPRDDQVITRGKNSVREVRQLDLFVESPSGRKEPKLLNDSTGCEERTMQSIRIGSGKTELDLELRLGPEPLLNTKNTIIEFF